MPYGAPSCVGSCQIATIAVPPRVIGCAVALAAADAEVDGVVVGLAYLIGGVQFGLGTDGNPTQLDIYWPSGTHQVIQAPAVDRLMNVVETP